MHIQNHLKFLKLTKQKTQYHMDKQTYFLAPTLSIQFATTNLWSIPKKIQEQINLRICLRNQISK